jgi:arylformamidase
MLIDISQPLSPGIAGFPIDTAYEEAFVARIGPGCPVNVGRLTMSTHCGTHADAPLHYDATGLPISALPLERFIGPARVIDARGAGPLCEPTEVLAALPGAPERVLLRLTPPRDLMVWPAGFRALSAATVQCLAAHGVTLIGVDAPSVDPDTSQDLPAHHACRRARILILENLVLDHVAPGDYELIALPLKLQNLDASPVRAVLRR